MCLNNNIKSEPTPPFYNSALPFAAVSCIWRRWAPIYLLALCPLIYYYWPNTPFLFSILKPILASLPPLFAMKFKFIPVCIGVLKLKGLTTGSPIIFG